MLNFSLKFSGGRKIGDKHKITKHKNHQKSANIKPDENLNKPSTSANMPTDKPVKKKIKLPAKGKWNA